MTIIRPTYEELQAEVARLKEENAVLRKRLAQFVPKADNEIVPFTKEEQPTAKKPRIQLSLEQKVELFRSLFVGREDVFARRWFSKAMNKDGYQPVCLNEWRAGVCDKKKHKCADCPNRLLKALEYEDVYRHLAGKDECGRDVVGLYPIREDNTCQLLCADFDDKSCEHGYKEDVLAYVSIAKAWGVNAYIERSRSGNGAHVWIFFEEPVAVTKARRLGNALITEAMNRRGQMSLKSYDRLFPNQDSITDGGFGNLVALPLQGLARRKGNSVFVDEEFNAIDDQWGFLQNITKLSQSKLETTLATYCASLSLGVLSTTSESKPWETPTATNITTEDFSPTLTIVRAGMLYVPLNAVSSKVINHLKRTAAFLNPEFYKKQAMRLPTYNVPRIVSCSEMTDNELVLPRGCEESVVQLLEANGADFNIEDKSNAGHPINVRFNGVLRQEQQEAVNELMRYNNGILHATTAFGKTVTAIGLIAERKVSTLILVHTKALLDQWKERLETFLDIDFTEEDMPKKRGRKRKFSPFGTLDSSGNSLHGQVDVALIQSCLDESNDSGVKDFVCDYGMVIVDECHHVSAVNFEQVLRHVTACYVYGLTATPIRHDGHQPIIYMQCGPIRYTADAKHQMQQQNFQRVLIPRFTSFCLLPGTTKDFTVLKDELAEDELRNKLIADDTAKAVAEGRTPIILTSLTKHVTLLSELLRQSMPDTTIVTLIGSEKAKEKRKKMALLANFPSTQPLVIIATGKYIGEGFDYPRLDTLMLALPIVWKGLIAQYAGRLHRKHNGKTDVQIYDYIDLHVPMAEKMYRKRLKGYAAIGYSAISSAEKTQETTQSIFNGDTYFNQYAADIRHSAKHSIVIVQPKIWLPHHVPLLDILHDKQAEGIEVAIITSQESAYADRLCNKGLNTTISADTNLTCAIMDKSLVWYGSMNFLTNCCTDEYAIRIKDTQFACDLMGITHIKNSQKCDD